MRALACVLVVLFVLGCTSQTDTSQESSSPSAQAQDTSQSGPVALGWPPAQACGFIGSNFGVAVGSYFNVSGNEYGCNTPYKTLGESSGLPNNLAYYVTGTQNLATEVELVLNVNERSTQEDATEQLEKFAGVITKAATGSPLPHQIEAAIKGGKPSSFQVNGYNHEVSREDWPTGKGYEVHYTITRVTEG